MSRKRWLVADYDKALARELAEECDIDALVALILVSRGICDPFEVEEFLSDDQQLGDPFDLADMDKACERILSAIEKGENICVYGDYDADGVTSTAILYTYLKSKGAKVTYKVPERSEGYGISISAVDQMHSEGVKLIITVDNGITAAKEVAHANSLGIDTVVTDHHLPQGDLPDAVAVVDPHREDCPSPFKEYAGAGVAFKVVCALEGVSGEEMCQGYADLAAIGTVADVMKLTGENRLIVKRGIENIDSRAGLTAVLDVAGLRKRGTSATTVSYGIAPRLNAAGRVGSCLRAVRLLTEEDASVVNSLAKEVNEANALRQQLERDISEQAIELIEKNGMQYDRVIVVYGQGWHHGVIGIVASRICNRYGRPAIVLSDEDGIAVGSARSVGEFSLYDAIASCSDMLIRFGGHAQAAGVSLAMDKVDDFRRGINEYAKSVYGDMPFDTLNIDCKLRPSAITPDLVRSLDVLAPFGVGNPVPVFGLFCMRIDRIMPVGNGGHLRLEVSRDGAVANVMLFGCSADKLGFCKGDIVDLAVNAEITEYMGHEQVTITVKGIRPANVDEGQTLNGIRLFERLMRNEEIEGATLTRDDIVKVYRALQNGFSGNEEALAMHCSLGYFAMRTALEVLGQLGIITCTNDGGNLTVALNAVEGKMQLENSPIFRQINNL